jgi:hypothetical protein
MEYMSPVKREPSAPGIMIKSSLPALIVFHVDIFRENRLGKKHYAYQTDPSSDPGYEEEDMDYFKYTCLI